MLTGTVILSIGIFNGVMLAAILWFARQSRFMAIGILAYCLMLLKYLGYWVEFLPEQRFLAELLRPTELLLGPLVLGCFYRLGSGKLKYEWAHYLPALLLLFFSVGNYGYIQLTGDGTYTYGFYVFIFKMVHEIGYLAAVIWLFRNQLDKPKILLIIFFSLQWAISILYLLFRFQGKYDMINSMLFGGMAFSINYLAFVALKKSSIFKTELPPEKDELQKPPATKNETSRPEPDSKPTYDKLLILLEADELFLSQNIKISNLARALSVTEKSVSRAVNEHAGENFNAFINRYRVNHAAKLIISDTYSHYTIDAIAEEAGFANKVSFYKAFRRIEGISPSEYRKKHFDGPLNNLSS